MDGEASRVDGLGVPVRRPSLVTRREGVWRDDAVGEIVGGRVRPVLAIAWHRDDDNRDAHRSNEDSDLN